MNLGYDLRVIWAVAVKDIRVALTDRVFTIGSVIIPLNFLLLFILFVIGGGLAPTAVVLQDNGPYARQFVAAMRRAHSFTITETSAADARQQISEGRIVAIVTVPATFDADLRAGRRVALPVTVNNLEVDFTNDIRRAVPLAITSFYSEAYPNQVVVQAREVDTQARDTNYIQYLSVSILVVGVMLGGLLQAGSSAAREYERQTVKELMLSPASRWAIETGKVLGAAALNLFSAAIVIAVVILAFQVIPVNWGELLGFTLLIVTIFVALGVLLGTLARRRQSMIPLAMGLTLPIFFLSGAFGPVNWGSPTIAAIARALPVYYAIGAFQHAFHGFDTTETGPGVNALVLLGFAALAVALSVLVVRRERVAH
ncbi:MAG TPA: ABC transporter permease [Ktedonobacterales bacterium]